MTIARKEKKVEDFFYHQGIQAWYKYKKKNPWKLKVKDMWTDF